MSRRFQVTEAIQAASMNIRRYARSALRPDLIAGLSVAMIALPQSMAYAQLAGMPPIYGLYSVIVPTLVGALFGSSSFLVTGSSNATSLATAGVLAVYLALPEYPEYAFLMAVLSGLVRMAMGLLRLGFIMRYVSNSVLTGLLAAIATLIIINQVPSLLGISRPAEGGTAQVLTAIATGIGSTNLYVLATGLVAALALIILRRLSKRLRRNIPALLVAIILSAILVAAAGWHEHGVRVAADLSSFENVTVRFHLPQVPLQEIPGLLNGALALSIFSLMEGVNVAKAIGANTGERIDASREFVGQGLASLVGGFFQSFPTSGSPARTTVNYTSGAKTRFASAFSGIFVWAALLGLSRWIGYIPNAALAGVLIVSATGVFNIQHIRLTWQSRGVSRWVLVITYLSALLLPLQYAIYVGVGLSIMIYLYESSRLQMSYLTRDENGHFVEHNLDEIVPIQPHTVLVNIEGPLYFGATEDLERQLMRIFHSGIKVVILRMRRVHLLASTGVSVLENVLYQANRLGILVLFSGVTGEVAKVLKESGLSNLIGPEQTFPASHTLFAATREALETARRFVNGEPLAETLHDERLEKPDAEPQPKRSISP